MGLWRQSRANQQHPASLSVKTAPSWRGIVPSTHLAREGRMTVTIGRRELLAALGGAAMAWPLAASAQQPSSLVGVLHSGSHTTFAPLMIAFRRGLQEGGFIEGQNVTIEYRWAENQYDRLPAMAAELVHLQPAVIYAGGSVRAAKAATSTIPIVFTTGEDPVKAGLVDSLNRGVRSVSAATCSGPYRRLRPLSDHSNGSTDHVSGPSCHAHSLSMARCRNRWRIGKLRYRYCRQLSAGGRLCRTHS